MIFERSSPTTHGFALKRSSLCHMSGGFVKDCLTLHWMGFASDHGIRSSRLTDYIMTR